MNKVNLKISKNLNINRYILNHVNKKFKIIKSNYNKASWVILSRSLKVLFGSKKYKLYYTDIKDKSYTTILLKKYRDIQLYKYYLMIHKINKLIEDNDMEYINVHEIF